ncbi:MAG: hypothetical protein HQL64_03130 [Magnetococcales bacterium]|nr:hypothetical protein [Magnetococcales bacterium]
MSEPIKSAGVNPFSGNRGKALHRLEPDVPFWWRKTTSRMVTVRTQQLQADGKLFFTRTDLEQFFTDQLPPPPRKKSTGDPPAASSKRSNALTGLEEKMDSLLELIRPQSGQTRTHQTPVPIQFGGHRLAFWEKDPQLKTGDHIEIHLGLFPDEYMLVHGYAQVIQTTHDTQSGLTRVFCQMVAMGHGVPRLAHNLPHDTPTSKPSPPLPEPATAKAETTPATIPNKAAETPPSPPSQEILSAIPPASEPLFQVDSEAVKDDDSNRRQAYRVNDDVAFSWKIVSRDDVIEAQGYFKQNDRLPIRNRESRLRNLLDQHADNLKRLDKRFSRTEVLLSWFRTELLVVFQRALRSQDEEDVLRCVTHLHAISAEIATQPEAITAQFGQVLMLIRKRLENQQKISILDPLLSANRINEGQEIIKRSNQEIDRVMREIATLTPALVQKLAEFDRSMDVLQLPRVEAKKNWLSSSHHMVKSQVNLSATGVAFRTTQDILDKGDYIQLNLELSVDGTVYTPYTAYGQVVLVKQLAVGKPYRIATQFILVPRKMEEDLGAHIARKQRELLMVK